MKRVAFFLLLFLLFFPFRLLAADDSTEHPERPWDFSLELTQMLTLQLELEYFFNDNLGIKAGFGASLLGSTCFTYNALFVYHFNLPADHFQLDFEAGLPVAYFDFIEGRYVDWDPIIDDPYFGFAPGAAFLFSYRFNEEHALGLRLGAAVKIEHQLESGWTENRVLPVFTLVYNF